MVMGSVEKRTLVLVCLAGIMERADEMLLPAVYKEVGAALHVSMTALGSLTLFRTLVQSACYPLAVSAAARHNRCHVIAAGAFLWAVATFLVAISSTYSQVAMSRAFNGIGLALVAPSIQSLIADCTPETDRGSAFGWLQLTAILGGVLGGVSSLLLASHSFKGVDGWRVVFLLIGILSVFVGLIVAFFGVDPHFLKKVDASNTMSVKSFKTELKGLFKEAREVMKIPSFQIIITQGITGSFPFSALGFVPMWLELIGFTHGGTGLLFGMFMTAFAIGGPSGGKIGDYLSKRYPNTGRIILSQISSGAAVPIAAVLTLALPNDPSTTFSHGLVFFSLGLSFSLNIAANNPIFAEIVPERSRTSIYALSKSVESLVSSFALPAVGILADAYGYKPVPEGSIEVHSFEMDRKNAASLAKAICTAITIPMSVCCLLYSFLYCTYPRDKERAEMHSLMESEMQHVDLERTRDTEDISQYQSCESLKRRTLTDMAYREEDTGMDDDEHALLSRQVVAKNERD
ncbi:uncharacterized protein M6B38_308195 [Iris pallida]|uniref:Major facilitator superfamily (MFS) profile domain-containing protein n=1 Tax=Iris pallida TaxID=29817 RepID=A0AAX6HKD5_IRIPA|nr:uncharacterized protein M6B38_308195 [Iris pallida]